MPLISFRFLLYYKFNINVRFLNASEYYIHPASKSSVRKKLTKLGSKEYEANLFGHKFHPITRSWKNYFFFLMSQNGFYKQKN